MFLLSVEALTVEIAALQMFEFLQTGLRLDMPKDQYCSV